MGVKVKIHRGMRESGNSGMPEQNYMKEVEYGGGNLYDLMQVVEVDANKVGLVVVNGRIVADIESAQVKPGDTVEFYPPMMGG